MTFHDYEPTHRARQESREIRAALWRLLALSAIATLFSLLLIAISQSP